MKPDAPRTRPVLALPSQGSTTLRRPRRSRVGLGFCGLAFLAGLLISATLVSAAGGDGEDTADTGRLFAGFAGLWIAFVGGPAIAARLDGTRVVDAFALRFRRRDVPLGIVTGTLTQLLVVPAVTWPLQQALGGDAGGSARDLLDQSGLQLALIIAAVVAGAPVVEELFFRGLVLRSLAARCSDRVAIIATSAVFASTHFQLLPFPGLLCAGLLFAWLTWRYDRLGPAIVAHAAFNATTVVAVLITR